MQVTKKTCIFAKKNANRQIPLVCALLQNTEVYAQDQLEVRKGAISYKLTVLDMPASRVGAKLVGLYCEDHTPDEAFEQAAQQAEAQAYYRAKGEGRPTKKDRRALDALTQYEATDPDLLND